MAGGSGGGAGGGGAHGGLGGGLGDGGGEGGAGGTFGKQLVSARAGSTMPPAIVFVVQPDQMGKGTWASGMVTVGHGMEAMARVRPPGLLSPVGVAVLYRHSRYLVLG